MFCARAAVIMHFTACDERLWHQNPFGIKLGFSLWSYARCNFGLCWAAAEAQTPFFKSRTRSLFGDFFFYQSPFLSKLSCHLMSAFFFYISLSQWPQRPFGSCHMCSHVFRDVNQIFVYAALIYLCDSDRMQLFNWRLCGVFNHKF